MPRSLFTLVLLWALAAHARPFAVARVTGAAVTIDAELSEWNVGLESLAPELFFGEGTSFTETGRVASNDDQSARFFFALSPTELLVAVIVHDDAVVTVRGAEQWKGDGVELLFPRAGAPMLHLGVNPVGDVHVYSPRARPEEARVRAVARPERDGWVLELAIPRGALGLGDEVSAVPMNLAMRDVDPGEAEPAHRVWSGQRHGQEASAGQLLFDRRPEPAVRWPTCPAPTATVPVRTPLSARGRALLAGSAPVTLRMVNFQSALRNWQTFWTDFQPAQLKADLDVARRLGANAVRVFVFTEAFGEERLVPAQLEHLHLVVREAGARGLLTVPTFFPFKKEFRPEWRARMRAHLEAVVSSFRGDPAVAMWDLMNEPDLSWSAADAGVSPAQVEGWAKEMAAAVRAADGTHLLTVGLAGRYLERSPWRPEEALEFVDVASVHGYGTSAELAARLRPLATSTRPVVLQEFGVTALYFTEDEARAQYEATCALARELGFAGVGAWELFDHPVGSIAHQLPRYSQSPENAYGLLSAEGRPRAQAGAFCRCLQVPAFKIGPPP